MLCSGLSGGLGGHFGAQRNPFIQSLSPCITTLMMTDNQTKHRLNPDYNNNFGWCMWDDETGHHVMSETFLLLVQDYQVDWEAILARSPTPFIQSVSPWLYPPAAREALLRAPSGQGLTADSARTDSDLPGLSEPSTGLPAGKFAPVHVSWLFFLALVEPPEGLSSVPNQLGPRAWLLTQTGQTLICQASVNPQLECLQVCPLHQMLNGVCFDCS